MIGKPLSRALEGLLDHPRLVLAVTLVLCGIAGVLAWGVEFQTSRRDLAPPGDPEQARWDALSRETGVSEFLIAVVEPSPGTAVATDDLRTFADLLSQGLEQSPLFESTFHRTDLRWILAHLLHLVPSDALRRVQEIREGQGETLRQVLEGGGLVGFHRALARRLRAGPAGATGRPGEEAAEGIRILAKVLAREQAFLEDPDGLLSELEAVPPLFWLASRWDERIASQGYLTDRDGDAFFVLALPAGGSDGLGRKRALLQEGRRLAGEIGRSFPDVRVGFTGPPATTVEEMDTVRRDTWRTSGLALLGVAALTLLVFRWKSHALVALLALGVGLLWSFGAVRLEYGYLNMITSSFLSTLVGVGIAYCIHPVSEYELEGAHLQDPRRAARTAYRRTGTAVAVAALTTAGAFFSILLMRFRGFAELGLVAGVGVVFCLLAALAVLPSLLVVYGSWRRGRDDGVRMRRPLLDRIWIEWLADHVCRTPRTVLALALAVSLLALWASLGIRFDTNIMNLLPRGAASLDLQRRMLTESELTPFQVLAPAEDLDELRAYRHRALQEPTIARFESVLPFLSEDPGLVSELGGWLAGLSPRPPDAPARREELLRSLSDLEEAFLDAADQAFAAGLGHLAGPLEEARIAAESLREQVAQAPDRVASAWPAAEERLLAWAGRAVEALAASARRPAPTLEDLPASLRGRYVTERGRLVAWLHPAGSVFERDFLDEFVAATRRVSSESTGFPIVFRQMSGRITAGFYQAVTAGAVLVFLLLLVDLRSLRDTLLALVPLAMGVLWMLGGMRLLGLSFNFANLVAVPLVIGVGIDNGVHIVHRVRLEGREGMHVVLRHTGRAILIASLTTMIGFGSLALAHHRGIASLGLVLLLGVGSCLVTSTLVLPNLLVTLGILRR